MLFLNLHNSSSDDVLAELIPMKGWGFLICFSFRWGASSQEIKHFLLMCSSPLQTSSKKKKFPNYGKAWVFPLRAKANDPLGVILIQLIIKDCTAKILSETSMCLLLRKKLVCVSMRWSASDTNSFSLLPELLCATLPLYKDNLLFM